MVTLAFVDLQMTYESSIQLYASLFSGTFPGGYLYEGAFYILILIIVGFWCLPMLVLIKLGVLAKYSVICLIWASC